VSNYETKSTNPKDRVGIEKLPLHLNPTTAAAHQSMAHLDGAIKYGPFNWRDEGVSVMVYLAAIKRHLDRYLEGERDAPDSKVHNLGHIMACCAIILDSEECGNLVDDRPGNATNYAELQSRLNEQVKVRVRAVNAKPASPFTSISITGRGVCGCMRCTHRRESR
jgi:hypothetical protein